MCSSPHPVDRCSAPDLPSTLSLPTPAPWRLLRSVQAGVVSACPPWLATARADALTGSPGRARLDLASPVCFAPPPGLPSLVRLRASLAVDMFFLILYRSSAPCSLPPLGSVRCRLQPLAALGSSVRRSLPSLRRSHRAASLRKIHKAAARLPRLDGVSVWLHRRLIHLIGFANKNLRSACALRVIFSCQLSTINYQLELL
jgi:hypothetical protein